MCILYLLELTQLLTEYNRNRNTSYKLGKQDENYFTVACIQKYIELVAVALS